MKEWERPPTWKVAIVYYQSSMLLLNGVPSERRGLAADVHKSLVRELERPVHTSHHYLSESSTCYCQCSARKNLVQVR